MPLLDEYILDDLLVMMQSLCRQWKASDIVITAIIDIFQGKLILLTLHHIY